MNELDQFRMTHEELIALYFEAKDDEGTELSSRKIADAATAKALREVVAWLRAEALVLEKRVSLNASYGLVTSSIRVRADRLDAMLGAAKEQGGG